MKANFEKYKLEFKRPSGTSRGVLKTKTTYFIKLEANDQSAVGEAALFKGLSVDDVPDYEEKLQEVCEHIDDYIRNYHEVLKAYPSMVFGLEQAALKLQNSASFCFNNDFTRGQRGIPINGLIWMGQEDFMYEQIESKLKEGFRCLKLKIGAIDFEKELTILKALRKRFSPNELELRVDANGAFSPDEAMSKLKDLSELGLHSIEQPIQAGQVSQMRELCESSPLDIALDEELIGVLDYEKKEQLLKQIQPPYIILKPALVGGFKSCDEWIQIAEEMDIGWWITSALESNVGLEAIAQYTASKDSTMYQGLGTGQLFTNNISSGLEIRQASLWMKGR